MIDKLILPIMIFCHIVDDYYLQGPLAKFKQWKWIKENYPQKLYKHDWIIALLEHSFSWSFMILLPILVTSLIQDIDITLFYILALLLNMIVHSIVDHLKANLLKINLTTDQLIHICQVIWTWACWIIIYK